MKFRKRLGLLACALALAPLSIADAMTVQPIVIDLETMGRGMSQVITVENTFDTPLPVELTVQRLETAIQIEPGQPVVMDRVGVGRGHRGPGGEVVGMDLLHEARVIHHHLGGPERCGRIT